MIGGQQQENAIQGTAVDAAYEGISTHMTMKAKDGSSVIATVSGAGSRSFPEAGSAVTFAFGTRDAIVLPV